VPVADIYEIFTTRAPRGWGRAPVQNYRWSVVGTINFTAEYARFTEAANLFCAVSKAGPVVDTSTKIFRRVENFRLEFVCEVSIQNFDATIVKYPVS
jgi:hypothetical protein